MQVAVAFVNFPSGPPLLAPGEVMPGFSDLQHYISSLKLNYKLFVSHSLTLLRSADAIKVCYSGKLYLLKNEIVMKGKSYQVNRA